MSDGLKTGLILGGAGLVALLIFKNSQVSAAAAVTAGTGIGIPTIPGTGSVLAAAPGATASATLVSTAVMPAATSSKSTIAKVASAVPSAIGKGVAFSVTEPYLIAKSVGTSIGNTIKSIF